MRKGWILGVIVIFILSLASEVYAASALFPVSGDSIDARKVKFSWLTSRYIDEETGDRRPPLLTRIQIFKEHFGGELVLDQTLSTNGEYKKEVEVELPSEGRYVWRTKDKSPFDNRWSHWYDFGHFFLVWRPPGVRYPQSPTGYITGIGNVPDGTCECDKINWEGWVNFEWSGAGDTYLKSHTPEGRGIHLRVWKGSSNLIYERRCEFPHDRCGTLPEGYWCVPLGRSFMLNMSEWESGSYGWAVREKNEFGWGEWSYGLSFTLWRRVRLLVPDDNATWHPITPTSEFTQVCLAWKLVDPGPIGRLEFEYQIWKTDENGELIRRVIKRTTRDVSECVNIPNDESFGEGYYIWTVRDPAGPTLSGERWPEKRRFRIVYRPAKPEIISPVENAKCVLPKPTFKWRKALHATSYDLELRAGSASGKVVLAKRLRPFVGIVIGKGGIESYKPANPLPVGKYVLKIRSVRTPPGISHAEEKSPWAIRRFEIMELTAKKVTKKKMQQIPSAPALSSGGESRGTPLIRTDSSPPDIKILSPKNNEKIKMSIIPATITVIARVDDAGSPASGIDRVEFWFNGRKVIEKKKPSEGSRYSAKIGALKEGWNRLIVKAYDRAGNHRSVEVRFYIEHVIKKPVIKKQTPVGPKVKPLSIKEK